MSMFRRLGMANFGVPLVVIQDATVQVLARNPATIEAGTTINSNAYLVFLTSGVVNGKIVDYSVPPSTNIFVSYNWLSVGGSILEGYDNTLYDIRWVKTAGTATSLSGGLANNTWYSMSADRTMALTNSTAGSTTFLVATVAIRYSSNGTIISSASCNFSSDRASTP